MILIPWEGNGHPRGVALAAWFRDQAIPFRCRSSSLVDDRQVIVAGHDESASGCFPVSGTYALR